MKKPIPITMEYVQSFFDLAKKEFSFLTQQGFALVEERRATGLSFKDGFHFRYAGHSTNLVVEYYHGVSSYVSPGKRQSELLFH